jgi:hypothetical protein
VKPPRPFSALPPRDMPRGTTSIVFGENQLSPSLIGLSPLPTAHRKLFQQLPVRASTRCYPGFTLAMGRSLRFRVYRHRLQDRAEAPPPRPWRLAFATAPLEKSLTSPVTRNSPDHNAKGTQSEACAPVQARGHTFLLPLVGTRFQDLFHWPPGLLFTFPSRYWCTIGHGLVFSLGGWSPQFPTGFLVSRRTQVPEPQARSQVSSTGLSPALAERSSSLRLPARVPRGNTPAPALQPRKALPPGLGSSPFARRYWGNLG